MVSYGHFSMDSDPFLDRSGETWDRDVTLRPFNLSNSDLEVSNMGLKWSKSGNLVILGVQNRSLIDQIQALKVLDLFRRSINTRFVVIYV